MNKLDCGQQSLTLEPHFIELCIQFEIVQRNWWRDDRADRLRGAIYGAKNYGVLRLEIARNALSRYRFKRPYAEDVEHTSG